ncbi:MAG: cell division protein SepF [Lachnospiraceae bacterium]|nr:cell division protein SepF [Lachnospiraceae bacterium]
MSITDKFLGLFRLNDMDDYDDYDDDFEDDYEDVPVKKQPVKAEKKVADDDDFDDEPTYKRTTAPKKKTSRSKVVSMGDRQAKGLEVCVIKPKNIDDSREITDTLLSGKAVILNLEGLNVDTSQRIIDFSSGSCYAIEGNLQKVSNYIFVITPPSVEISGDFNELLTGSFDMTTFTTKKLY